MKKIITLFHGSEKVIEAPSFGEGKEIMISGSDFTAPKPKILRKSGRFLL